MSDDRYVMPDFDPDGIDGPRHIGECTAETQIAELSGLGSEGLPGFLVVPDGTRFVGGDGEWRREDEEGGNA